MLLLLGHVAALTQKLLVLLQLTHELCAMVFRGDARQRMLLLLQAASLQRSQAAYLVLQGRKLARCAPAEDGSRKLLLQRLLVVRTSERPRAWRSQQDAKKCLRVCLADESTLCCKGKSYLLFFSA